MIVSHTAYKFIAVYILYGVCIKHALILCDPKRAHPDGAYEVCHVGWYSILFGDYFH